MSEDNINLMPEDLREREKAAAAKIRQMVDEPDLSVPEKTKRLEEDAAKMSGSKPSFFSNVSKLFAKKPKPVSDDIKQPSINQLSEKMREPLKVVIKDTPSTPVPPTTTRPPMPSFEPKPLPPKPMPAVESEQPVIKDSKFHQPDKMIRAKFVEDGVGVNLVPNSSKIKGWRQISTLLIMTVVSGLAILAIFYFGLITVNRTLDSNRIDTLNKINDIEKELLSFGEINKDINRKGKEISLVYGILEKHIYWTNFFRLLEKYTTEDVYYTGFSAGNNGGMVLEAVAKDYEAVGRQLKILQQEQAQEFATEVDISSANLLGEAGVGFSITLVLNPELFYYDNGL